MNIENLKNMPVVGQPPVVEFIDEGAQLPAPGTAVEIIASYVADSNTRVKSNANTVITLEEAANIASHDAYNTAEKQNFSDAEENVRTKAGQIIDKIEADQTEQEDAAQLLISNPTQTVDSILEFSKKLTADEEAINEALADATAELSAKRATFRQKFGTAGDFEDILVAPVFAGGLA